jgi:hypothetical protein
VKRSSPMARSPMRRKPRRPKPGDDPKYLQFVRTLPCCVCGAEPPSQASHVGTTRKGMGIKCVDVEAVPHCDTCHREWDGRKPRYRFCAGWTRGERMLWADVVIHQTQAAYERQGGVL